ncbi:MAG: hypothetical protein ACHQQ3_02755 [Gemmatimonadales bacterium]
MNGLAIGGALALAAALWVLGPIFRAGAAGAPPPQGSEPRDAEGGPCKACGAAPEPGAEYCAQCGRRRTG